VLSVYGDHLADAMFMKRTTQSTLMEFFPSNGFNRDWEIVVRTMGIRYVAWQGNQCVLILLYDDFPDLTTRYRKYTGDDLPAFSQSSTHDDFALDAPAVIRAITEELNRRNV